MDQHNKTPSALFVAFNLTAVTSFLVFMFSVA